MLLNMEKTDEAIKLFSLNTHYFPQSPNTWDSLGEACMKNGDKDKAIEYYEKALELDPESKTAQKALKKLR